MSFLPGIFCAFAVRDLVASVANSRNANTRRVARCQPDTLTLVIVLKYQ
jgi:hypothetical protein